MLNIVISVYALAISAVLFIGSVTISEARKNVPPVVARITEMMFAGLLMSVAWLVVK